MDQIILAFKFLLKHKFKILAFIVISAIFVVVLFPFKDLNDYISNTVAKATGNRVYLQFEDMHINPILTSLTLDQVSVDTSEIENLTIGSLTASPSFQALIQRQVGGHIKAEDILGGSLDVNMTPAKKSDSGAARVNLSVDGDKISLGNLKETFKLSFPITGTANIKTNVVADMAFTEQPDGDIQIVINNFNVPSFPIQLPNMGSINLPEFRFKQIDLKGKLSNGRLNIESAKLGAPTDDLYGTIKGTVNLSIQNNGGRIAPVFSGYNLTFDLSAKPAFKERGQLLLLMVDSFKTEEAGLTRYKFKLAADNMYSPAIPSPIN
ncbi:MAG: type II secretion system protein GspN [Pseudobdellovibrio sp.]